jgi:hypothetical protein
VIDLTTGRLSIASSHGRKDTGIAAAVNMCGVPFSRTGTAAILRFARPVAYQNAPQALLPAELQDGNPLNILRLVDDVPTRAALLPRVSIRS